MRFFWPITLYHKVSGLVWHIPDKMRFLLATGLTGRSLDQRRLSWFPLV